MSDYYRDDWNDEDQQVVDMQEVYTLENEVLDLRERVQDQETDEVFVLYHLMDLRDKHRGNAGLIASLDEIIKLHSKDVIQRAKMYTRRGEAWDYD